MKNKYGLIKECLYCKKEFETRTRFLDYCSQPCKNPNNRPGHTVWNKGIKLTEEQKSKQNTTGLAKGHGWNRGLSNNTARLRMLSEDNPNRGGAVNKKRKIDGTLGCPGEKNGMWGKKHTDEVREVCRQIKIQQYKDGVYWSTTSLGEKELLGKLRERFEVVIHQFTVPNYHRVYDMYIPSLNLIVEYDGNYWHREEKYLSKDSKDTEKAIKRGFKIFRYWESIVKDVGIDSIVEDIVKLEGKYCRILKEA